MKEHSINSTVTYYKRNAHALIDSYETAEMSNLHSFLLTHLIPDSKVLDIGFGSGRDLAFLQEHGYDIWGMDPVEKFVNFAKNRFQSIKDHFFIGSLPSTSIDQKLLHSFDNIILIAVWMHIPKELYPEVVKTLVSLLKPQGRLILSYSITPRTEQTERHFENIDPRLLQALFEQYGFKQIAKTVNEDGLSQREITWVTEAYSYDKS